MAHEPDGEADTQLAPAGSRLGDYLLEGRIGRGGMGAVYRARDTRNDRVVALKVLNETNPDLVRRFLREARLAASLRHPDIVEVLEICTLAGERPAIVMELLVGESLGQRLAREGALPLEVVAPIVMAVARAALAIHERGMVHRDLKPDNVFLVRDAGAQSAPVVKVLDFGIAKLIRVEGEPTVTGTPLTRTGQILGTPQYMAPEVIFGEQDIDGRADVWSMGVILYEALSGARPFDGDNVGQIFKAIALDPHVPLASRAPLVAPSVAALVERMLAHARAERVRDLREIIEVLAPFAAGHVEAPPVERAPTPRRRGATALALGVAMAGGGLLGALFLRGAAATPAGETAAAGASPAAASESTVASAPAATSMLPVGSTSARANVSPAGAHSAEPTARVVTRAADARIVRVTDADAGVAVERRASPAGASAPAPSSPLAGSAPPPSLVPAASASASASKHRSGGLRSDEL